MEMIVDEDYESCVSDLIHHEAIQSMAAFIQHRDITTLEHSISVSYYSYRLCKRLGLDYRTAARGALLHDFCLYDWHLTRPQEGLHGFVHPAIALRNATEKFELNQMEKDIILKHMWPLTLNFPRYKESFVVTFTDKVISLMEILNPSYHSVKMSFLDHKKDVLS
jgi:uncharacterized protein